MNIVVVNSSSRVFVRPDTTWERDNEDLYVPVFIGSLAWTPVIFAHISKPGRSIGARFGARYYDLVGAGVQLYPEDLMDGSAEGFACACCLDHSSFLPSPELAREDYDSALESCGSPASLLQWSESTGLWAAIPTTLTGSPWNSAVPDLCPASPMP